MSVFQKMERFAVKKLLPYLALNDWLILCYIILETNHDLNIYHLHNSPGQSPKYLSHCYIYPIRSILLHHHHPCNSECLIFIITFVSFNPFLVFSMFENSAWDLLGVEYLVQRILLGLASKPGDFLGSSFISPVTPPCHFKSKVPAFPQGLGYCLMTTVENFRRALPSFSYGIPYLSINSVGK